MPVNHLIPSQGREGAYRSLVATHLDRAQPEPLCLRVPAPDGRISWQIALAQRALGGRGSPDTNVSGSTALSLRTW